MPTCVRANLLVLLIVLGGAWDADSLARESLFAIASRNYQLEQWETAASGFAEVLESDTADEHHESATFYLAECQMQLGQYLLARNGYVRLLEEPNTQFEARTRFRVGEATLLAGEEKFGRDLLQRFVRDFPREPSAAFALCHLGHLSHEQGNFDASIRYYLQVLDDFPLSTKADAARLGLAKAMLLADRPEQVAGIVGLPEDYDEDANAAEASLLAGRAFFDLGDNRKALEKFRYTFENYVETVAARRARIAAAWVLWREEEFNEIFGIVEPLSDEPRWLADFHYLTGMAAYGGGQWEAGVKHLAKAAALGSNHPSHDAILFYQAVCYMRSDRIDVAKHLFERLCADYPRSKWSTEANRELSLIAPTRASEAESQEEETTTSNEEVESGSIASFYHVQPLAEPGGGTSIQIEDAKELLEEARGLERDARHGSAIAAYTELINLQTVSPFRPEGLRRNAKLHFQLKRHREAVSLYEQFLHEQPNSPHHSDVLSDVGWLMVELGERTEARNRFEELLEKFPQSAQVADAAYWLARDAADEKDSETARRYLRLAVTSLRENEDGSARQTKLLTQSLALRCQLAAEVHDWQTIIDLLPQSLPNMPDGSDRVRLEYWQAEALFRTKEYDRAREAFAKLDARTFGIHEAWVAMVPLRRAQLAARREQWLEVLKFVNRLVQDNSDFPLKHEADYLRGRAEAGRGNFSAARVAYEEVIASRIASPTETSVAAQWMIGETFLHQQNYEYARMAYQAVLDREAPADWQARAALQLGKCLELEERWEEARSLYSQALQRWPNSEPWEILEARLKWAESRARVRR